ncbi:Flp pilus assembly protein protease CpaA [Paenibacillus sp. 1182]|uniref:prepilin peptidase n=1 Tax=Paenibacillus sp. 1182 TaxID=2806565 RepID=UPI001AEB9E37|nr:A24 family peptidase [Paenibacillus sp. 1182]MBP1308771.1 Flp pilus assembly protein protease CpaA [Paenibacillus sp. 1182]
MFIDNYLENVQMSVEHVYQNGYIAMLFTLYLFIATIIDVKFRKIPNKLNLGFVLVRLILIPWFPFSILDLIGAVIAFIALLIPAMVKNHKMGGDIKMAGVVGLYMGMYLVPIFILLACIYFMVYVGMNKRMLPFAPFFLASHITLMVAYYVLM